VAAALTLGGSVRVGLEDNFYLPDGTMARSNGDLVAKARGLTEDVGRRAATVAEAREILGVPALGRPDAGHESQVAGLDAPRR
jgi:3-keto-5-aminohexanoate cleavage enzyme